MDNCSNAQNIKEVSTAELVKLSNARRLSTDITFPNLVTARDVHGLINCLPISKIAAFHIASQDIKWLRRKVNALIINLLVCIEQFTDTLTLAHKIRHFEPK